MFLFSSVMKGGRQDGGALGVWRCDVRMKLLRMQREKRRADTRELQWNHDFAKGYKQGRKRSNPSLGFFNVVVRILRLAGRAGARLTFLRRRGVLQTILRHTLIHPSGKSIQGLHQKSTATLEVEAGSRLCSTNAGATE